MKYYKISDNIPSVNAEDYKDGYCLNSETGEIVSVEVNGSVAGEGEGYIMIGFFNAFTVFEDEVEIELMTVNGETLFMKLTKGLWFMYWENMRTTSILLKNTQE